MIIYFSCKKVYKSALFCIQKLLMVASSHFKISLFRCELKYWNSGDREFIEFARKKLANFEKILKITDY